MIIQDILDGRISYGYTVPWAITAVLNDGWFINTQYPVVNEYGGTAIVRVCRGQWPGIDPVKMDTFEFFEWLEYACAHELSMFGDRGQSLIEVHCPAEKIKSIRLAECVPGGYTRVQMKTA